MKKIKLKIVLSFMLAFFGFLPLGTSPVFVEILLVAALFTIIALILAHKVLRQLKKDKVSVGWKSVTIITLIVCYFNIFYITISLFSLQYISAHKIDKLKSKDNLKQIYQLILVYSMDYNSLPKVTSEGGNGVRDFYPLYETGIMKRDQLELLHHPNAKLIPFSENPTIDEFDKNHIGYAYNSTAEMDSDSPLVSEQGVSDGILNKKEKDEGLKPVFENVAHVLFANAKIEKIPADRKGNLSTKEISKEEWKLLKD